MKEGLRRKAFLKIVSKADARKTQDPELCLLSNSRSTCAQSQKAKTNRLS
jgi:hypothetical protein